MILNLTEIFKEQDKLNAMINKNHDIVQSSVYNELKLATMVELGELANELKCFKFWSVKPRNEKEIILDEYSDGIHFLATLCNIFKIPGIIKVNDEAITPIDNKQLTINICKIFKYVSKINFSGKLKKNIKLVKKAIYKYIELGYQIGFNYDDIVHGYFKKHETNIERQNNNY